MNNFNPDWVSPPGDTISDILDERDMSPMDLAESMGIPIEQIHGILQGDLRINPHLASKLSASIGGSKNFWMEREDIYSKDKINPSS